MNRLVRLAAVAVPLLGLAGLWGLSDHTYRQGTDWEVPIMGYDPRDFLRGHYVEFSYDWPGMERDNTGPPDRLCLMGEAPALVSVRVLTRNTELADCNHPLQAELADIYGWQGLERGRLYVGQDRALALEQELRNADQRGIVTIRQREDGSFTPISIRFRPLTAQEISERDAQNAPLQPAAPPIMAE